MDSSVDVDNDNNAYIDNNDVSNDINVNVDGGNDSNVNVESYNRDVGNDNNADVDSSNDVDTDNVNCDESENGRDHGTLAFDDEASAGTHFSFDTDDMDRDYNKESSNNNVDNDFDVDFCSSDQFNNGQDHITAGFADHANTKYKFETAYVSGQIVFCIRLCRGRCSVCIAADHRLFRYDGQSDPASCTASSCC